MARPVPAHEQKRQECARYSCGILIYLDFGRIDHVSDGPLILSSITAVQSLFKLFQARTLG